MMKRKISRALSSSLQLVLTEISTYITSIEHSILHRDATGKRDRRQGDKETRRQRTSWNPGNEKE